MVKFHDVVPTLDLIIDLAERIIMIMIKYRRDTRFGVNTACIGSTKAFWSQLA